VCLQRGCSTYSWRARFIGPTTSKPGHLIRTPQLHCHPVEHQMGQSRMSEQCDIIKAELQPQLHTSVPASYISCPRHEPTPSSLLCKSLHLDSGPRASPCDTGPTAQLQPALPSTGTHQQPAAQHHTRTTLHCHSATYARQCHCPLPQAHQCRCNCTCSTSGPSASAAAASSSTYCSETRATVTGTHAPSRIGYQNTCPA
jgi:hypothetical protein